MIFFTDSAACYDSSACCECGENIEEKDEDHIDKRNARDSRVSLRRNHDGIGDAHESAEELLDDEREDERPEGFIAEAQLKLRLALVFAEIFFENCFYFIHVRYYSKFRREFQSKAVKIFLTK